MERARVSRIRHAVAVLSAVAMLAGLGPASGASAGPATERASGSCTGNTSWKLVVQRSGGKLSVVYRIIGGPSGHRWTIFLDDNGTGFFARSKRANKKGNLRVSDSTSNLPGKDVVSAAASDRSTGESCIGSVTI
jgi:hypothetical protein